MRIGIGCLKDPEKVAASALRFSEESGAHVICYTDLSSSCDALGGDVIRSEHPGVSLIDDLFSGKIDAAVRGSLPANSTLSYLKKKYGVPALRRIALLETPAGEQFFFAPVGVDEGWTVEDKEAFVKEGRHYAKACGLPEKTVVLAGGRAGDVGRHPAVDKSISDAEEVCRRTGAEFGEILIEDAVHDAGVIIAPDGISGNLIFRTLALLGTGAGLGAPVVNIPDIYVDSSRASESYDAVLRFTARLVSMK